VPGLEVDVLRQQLRERGYLSHGIERWFALDPWRSRAFWLELTIVAGKAAVLVALFAVLPLAAVMLFRNHPLSAYEVLALTLIYGVTAVAVSFLLLIVIALVLRLRPQLAVDTPRALLAISFSASAVLTAAIAVWWLRFGSTPSWPELLTGLVLVVIFFLIATVAVSAALLSFSIYELKRIPALHHKSRAFPMTTAAAILIALLFLPTYAVQDKRTSEPPLQIVTVPTTERVALLAVDGLTFELFRANPPLGSDLAGSVAARTINGGSATERWASVGTGVPAALHGVRAVEGVRLRGGRHLMQAVSSADFVLRNLAEAAGVASREPLPPTVRKRDYVWEIFAGRGMPAVAINWWTTEAVQAGALQSIDQSTVFSAAAADRGSPGEMAMHVDATASRMLVQSIDRIHPQIATAYLPALDIILNRLPLDASSKLALSVRTVSALESLIAAVRGRGYDVIVIGLPGDRQPGAAVIAWTMPGVRARRMPSAYDVAPTLCQLLGFPDSDEMPGRSLIGRRLARVLSYGARSPRGTATKVNDEYYQSLRSLGYIR